MNKQYIQSGIGLILLALVLLGCRDDSFKDLPSEKKARVVAQLMLNGEKVVVKEPDYEKAYPKGGYNGGYIEEGIKEFPFEYDSKFVYRKPPRPYNKEVFQLNGTPDPYAAPGEEDIDYLCLENISEGGDPSETPKKYFGADSSLIWKTSVSPWVSYRMHALIGKELPYLAKARDPYSNLAKRAVGEMYLNFYDKSSGSNVNRFYMYSDTISKPVSEGITPEMIRNGNTTNTFSFQLKRFASKLVIRVKEQEMDVVSRGETIGKIGFTSYAIQCPVKNPMDEQGRCTTRDKIKFYDPKELVIDGEGWNPPNMVKSIYSGMMNFTDLNDPYHKWAARNEIPKEAGNIQRAYSNLMRCGGVSTQDVPVSDAKYCVVFPNKDTSLRWDKTTHALLYGLFIPDRNHVVEEDRSYYDALMEGISLEEYNRQHGTKHNSEEIWQGKVDFKDKVNNRSYPLGTVYDSRSGRAPFVTYKWMKEQLKIKDREEYLHASLAHISDFSFYKLGNSNLFAYSLESAIKNAIRLNSFPIRFYQRGMCAYRLLINPVYKNKQPNVQSRLDEVVSAQIDSNTAYVINVNEVLGVGINWNGLNPYDRNLVTNMPNEDFSNPKTYTRTYINEYGGVMEMNLFVDAPPATRGFCDFLIPKGFNPIKHTGFKKEWIYKRDVGDITMANALMQGLFNPNGDMIQNPLGRTVTAMDGVQGSDVPINTTKESYLMLTYTVHPWSKVEVERQYDWKE